MVGGGGVCGRIGGSLGDREHNWGRNKGYLIQVVLLSIAIFGEKNRVTVEIWKALRGSKYRAT